MSKKSSRNEKKSATAPKLDKGNMSPANPLLRSDVLKLLNKSKKHDEGVHISKISEAVGISDALAKQVLTHLSHHDGYNIISCGDNRWKVVADLGEQQPLELQRLLGKEYTFGVVTDSHICNVHSRLDVLEAAYTYFAQQGITDVIHAGNIIDGQDKNNQFELLAHGVHDQAQYLSDHYPQRDGITTHFLTGECHEGWFQKREGLKIGWYLQKWAEDCGREDLKHLGFIERDIILEQPFGKTLIRVIHPGGGSAYALSYTSQKMVESFQGGDKPHVMIMGHYHKFDFNYVREVACLQPGCVQDQTTFMRKKKLAAHVGFCTLTIGARIDGTIGQVSVNWFPFYDVAYHNKLNEYKID